MKKYLYLFVIIALCSCAKGTEFEVPWGWNEEISSDGGIVIFKPLLGETDLFPRLEAVTLRYYDAFEELKNVEKLKNVSPSHVEGEWYKIETSVNKIQITLQPNNTQYRRKMDVFFRDGSTKKKQNVSIIQRQQ